MCVSEAAVARERTAPRIGWASGTRATKADLATVKAVDMVSSQVRTFGLPASVSVSSWRILATPQRKKLIIPRNRCTALRSQQEQVNPK
jgi:hypothetical protein